MAYDPFARGPYPAAVRSEELSDPARGGRTLPLELWYPATDGYTDLDFNDGTRDTYEVLPGLPAVEQDAVRDASPRRGPFPLVLFSHGYGGHRRQSTFLCTHLASHGYVVAAVDHSGNTVLDVMQAVLAIQTGQPPHDPAAVIREFVAARPADVRFMLDQVLAGAGEVARLIDAERVGMTGHSFGGWTTLTTTAREPRIRAAVPLAPAGGSNPLGPAAILEQALDLEWGRDVPTLFIVADRDSLLPLRGMREIFARTPGEGKRMVVLKNADHMHFCDRVEEIHEVFRTMPQDPIFESIRSSIPPIGELSPGTHAHLAVRGLTLAHFDAHLKGDEAAAEFLAGDVRAALAAHDVDVG
jgi:predicted dienelactone hydrolase